MIAFALGIRSVVYRVDQGISVGQVCVARGESYRDEYVVWKALRFRIKDGKDASVTSKITECIPSCFYR